MNTKRPTPETGRYRLMPETRYEDQWISIPDNGGDVGSLADIVDELNRLLRERDEALEREARLIEAVARALPYIPEINQPAWNLRKVYDALRSEVEP